jgi:hypothetical protein
MPGVAHPFSILVTIVLTSVHWTYGISCQICYSVLNGKVYYIVPVDANHIFGSLIFIISSRNITAVCT